MGNVENFLKEYEQLCQKYKMGLIGCGCCGSPYLYSKANKKELCDINYNENLDKVFINGDGFWHELELKGDVNKRELANEKTIEDYIKEKE